MSFIPISVDKYVKLHLQSNPTENELNLRARLDDALDAFKKGEKCHCGNDIWVIGSATVGHSCFTCITGEHFPTNDYELDAVIQNNKKDKNKSGA